MALQPLTSNAQKRLALSLLLTAPISLYAENNTASGKLGDFEQAAKRPASTTAPPSSSGHQASSSNRHYRNRKRDSFLDTLINDITFAILSEGSKHSLQNTRKQYAGLQRRDNVAFNSLNPLLRFDADYLNAESDVTGQHFNFSANYGAIGLHLSQEVFEEETPNAALELQTIEGRFRMVGQGLSVSFGIGQTRFDGQEKDTGLSISLPIQGRISPHWQWEFHPSRQENFGNTRETLDFGILWHDGNHVGIKSGYRKLKNGSATIEGFYLGVSAFY